MSFLFLGSSPQSDIYNTFTDAVSQPGDPANLILVILLAAIFFTMSWFSRTGGNWGGRFSPFGRPSNSASSNEVTDGDFSYITSEDLANAAGKGRHRSSRTAAREIVDWDDKNPGRDTDILVFKHGRADYPTHFPAQSIQDGDLMIGTMRQAAARKMGINDPKRIRMFFKGRNLKHDERTAREEGLRGDGAGSEILCVVGEAGTDTMVPAAEETGVPGIAQRSWSNASDEGGDTDGGTDSGPGMAAKESRKRGGRKNKKKKNVSGTSTPAAAYSNPNAAGSEYLPIPSHIPTPRPTSAPPQNIPRAATPQTPIGKLDAIASKFHIELVPLCVTFMSNPPEEKARRDFEYKKLSETILAQVLLKLDGVETEGNPDARSKRKELVKEVQGMLNKLDETVK